MIAEGVNIPSLKAKSASEMARTMRRMSICAHISLEEETAVRISKALSEGADMIERMEQELIRNGINLCVSAEGNHDEIN